MHEMLFTPVFTAEARALINVLKKEVTPGQNGHDLLRVKAVLKTLLPDIMEIPARMKRLNDALVEWIMAEPRSGNEVEQAREELSEILQTQVNNLREILEAAIKMGFPVPTITLLKNTLDEIHGVQGLIFQHWQPFTHEDFEATVEEIKNGQGDELNEVIRELQGRVK